ncbi:AEC family transporter [Salibaculum halophilum]|uniref:AEC family transporter n=1 Tax=Salibaculum halophilum TaxID=1914408 RepID=UPI000A0F9D99|nr:AEC family transporter [Salibaculum halophilum]
MGALASVIAPVFLVVGAGYLARWRGWMTDSGIDGLMTFAQGIAIPLLLFRAIATLELGRDFDVALLLAFYCGALAGFLAGLAGARALFRRSWEDSIAIGFVGLFSNSLLLGLPITERAYGTGALTANYAIIALHAPFCYAIGITAMEIARAGGTPARALPGKVVRAIFSNALVLGITAGFGVNLAGVALPAVMTDAVDLLVRAGIPAALFGLGGVLHRYRPEGDMRVILFICAISLVLHPAITFGLGRALGLSTDGLRSAVLTGAMAPGVNAYLFANLYGVARRVAASAVLIGTGLTILTATVWLSILP